MPVHKVKLPDGTTGYQWGRTGKIYKDPRKAYAQGVAIQHAQQRRGQPVQKVAAYQNALRKVALAPVIPQVAQDALMPSPHQSSRHPAASLQDHSGFPVHVPGPGNAYGTPQHQQGRRLFPAANATAQSHSYIPWATRLGSTELYKNMTQFNGKSVFRAAPGHSPEANDSSWYYNMIDRGQVFDAQGNALTRETAERFGVPGDSHLGHLRDQFYDTRLGTRADPGNQQQRAVLQYGSGETTQGRPYLRAVADPSFALKDNSGRYYNPQKPTQGRMTSIKRAQEQARRLQQQQQRKWQEQQRAYQEQLERQRNQIVVQPVSTAEVQQRKATGAEAGQLSDANPTAARQQQPRTPSNAKATSQPASAALPPASASDVSHTTMTRPDRPQQNPSDHRSIPVAPAPAKAPERRTWTNKDGVTIVRSPAMMKWLSKQRMKTQQYTNKLQARANAHTEAINNGNDQYALQQRRRAKAQQAYRAKQRERAAQVRQSFGRPLSPAAQPGKGSNAQKIP